jgi:hypothetical protein
VGYARTRVNFTDIINRVPLAPNADLPSNGVSIRRKHEQVLVCRGKRDGVATEGNLFQILTNLDALFFYHS